MKEAVESHSEKYSELYELLKLWDFNLIFDYFEFARIIIW